MIYQLSRHIWSVGDTVCSSRCLATAMIRLVACGVSLLIEYWAAN